MYEQYMCKIYMYEQTINSNLNVTRNKKCIFRNVKYICKNLNAS